MHFIGMMAFSIPGIEIKYDVILMLLSMIVAVLGSGLGIYIVNKEHYSQLNNILGAISMGLAISSMHYIGIWSMEMPMKIEWKLAVVVMSVLVGIVASYLAIIVATNLKTADFSSGLKKRILGALLMGFAISSMHYTGMMGMDFVAASDMNIFSGYFIESQELIYTVVIGTIIILSISLLASRIDQNLSQKKFANEQLRHAIESRDEFMSLASHELKTPLTSLKLQIQLIDKKLEQEQVDLAKLKLLLKKVMRV